MGILPMRLTAKDVESIINSSVPKPRSVTAEDFVDVNAQVKNEIVQGFTSQKNQSRAREGEILPPPPKNLVTITGGAFDELGAPLPEGEVEASLVEAEEAELALLEDPQSDIPPALLGVDLDQINSRAELIYALTQNIPANEIGLPKYLYSTDMLDHNMFHGTPTEENRLERYKEMQSYLEAAQLHLRYHEGFPSLPTGEPLWAKLPFESSDQHGAFLEYCEMPGARQIARLPNPKIADQAQKWFHENYWSVRVKCYDMLHAIHAQKVREQRILACEDNHYLEADKLFQQLRNMQGDVKWESLAEDPKEYIAVMEKVVKLQRLALGQSTMGNSADRRELKSETTEMVLRKMVGPISTDETPQLKGMTDEGIQVRKLLRNPEALATAQELIVRMTRVTQTMVPTPAETEE